MFREKSAARHNASQWFSVSHFDLEPLNHYSKIAIESSSSVVNRRNSKFLHRKVQLIERT